jgi:predicted metalloprotease
VTDRPYTRPVRRVALLAVSMLALLAACAAPDPGVTASRAGVSPEVPPATGEAPPETPPAETTVDTTADTTVDPTAPDNTLLPNDTTVDNNVPVTEGVVDFGSSKPPQDYDGFLVAVFLDVQTFWEEQFPEVFGQPFQSLEGGIFAAYPDRAEPIPGCGEPQTAYQDVEGNAFYCSLGDFMVYDDAFLIPDLVEQLGRSAVGVVLAHEYGHAITARLNQFDQPTILKEQQADCFAGAWAAHVARGESDIAFGDEDIKAGLIAMIQVRDPVEASGTNDPAAHGTGFDRVGAFQDGFVGGVARCATFFDEQRSLISIPFDPSDVNEGNLPFDQIITGTDTTNSIVDELVRYWTTLFAGSSVTFTPPVVVLFHTVGPFPDCPDLAEDDLPDSIQFCPSTNEVLVDEDFGRSLAGDPFTGDMSVGYLLSNAFSESVLASIGSRLTGEARAMSNECLTGSWVRDMVPPLPDDRPAESLQLSAGDLDEAIIVAIARGDERGDDNVRGTPFEKINAFRIGVLQGRDGCDT